METMGLIQRRQFVVDPKFQYGFILKSIFLVTVVLLVSLVLLTIVFNLFINIALPVSIENGGVMSFGAMRSIMLPEEIRLLTAVMAISVIIASIGVYIFGVSSSHRVIGPVFRLRNYVNEMIHGGLDQKVSLREKDYFQALATDINRLRQHWHDSVLELQNINKQLNEVSHAEQKELTGRSNKILSDLYKKVL